MRFDFRRFFVCFLCCVLSISARADVRAGAPRPLGENNGFIKGTHAHFENGALNFVHTEDARLQLWRAWPENPTAKNLNWSTQAHSEQSPYLLDLLASQRTFSPDGKTIGFVSQRGGQSAVYIVAASDFGRQERARRIAVGAQSPAWLDENTLIFESTNAGRGGLFRVAISGDEKSRPAPQLLFSRGGESAVAPDQQTICVAAKIENSDVTQLYLLSADGSGARAIPQTEGARRPCFSLDGSAIFFDAPAPQSAVTNAPRAGSTPSVLWTVPLTAAPPTAQLFFVRENQNGDAEIIGTLFSGDAGELQSQIEFWPGEETEFSTRPQFVLPIKNAPIHNAALVAWPLQQNAAPQEWTLRLSAQNKDGQSTQSTLTFLWPPAQKPQPILASIPQPPIAQSPIAQSPIAQPPNAPQPLTATIQTAPVQVAPVVVRPIIVAPTFPIPATSNTLANVQVPPRVSSVLADLPAPALPPAPRVPDEELSLVPFPVSAAPRAGSTPAVRLAAETPVRRGLTVAKKAPAQKPPPKTAAPKKPPASKSPAKPQPKPAPKKSSVIPSQMKAGSSTSVEVKLRNTGTRSWSSTGNSPVRLLVRWVRADSKTRHRWAIKWLRSAVAPGQSTTAKIDLDAPSTPGRYILTYSLVRLSPEIYNGKSYKPPPADAPDAPWPGEFGAVSFAIDVR